MSVAAAAAKITIAELRLMSSCHTRVSAAPMTGQRCGRSEYKDLFVGNQHTVDQADQDKPVMFW